MSSPNPENSERQRLEGLSTELREATYAALSRRSVIAASLDESRTEVDRLLMLDGFDPLEYRRVVVRAQMMLDTWRNMSGASTARSR